MSHPSAAEENKGEVGSPTERVVFATIGTLASFEDEPRPVTLHLVTNIGNPIRALGLRESRRQRYFYAFFLPLGVLANLGLGLLILASLNPGNWAGWLEVATGALCCFIAGWLGAALWSHSYWHRSMVNQVTTWQRIADAFFSWVEEAPVPAEAVRSLRSTLEDAVPTSERR